jgi:integrase
MGKPSTSGHPSTIVNRTVTPRRPRNADLREREYLTLKEVDRLQDAARKHSRYGHRDATAILIAYRHGLRASELCELTWNMIELDSGRKRRVKNGVDSTHPLTGKEIRALRQLRRENLQSRYVFNTERGRPRLRFQVSEQWCRYSRAATLPGPPQHHGHGAVYRTALRSFRRVLEGLTPQRIAEQRQRDFQGERPRGGLEVK